MGYTKTDKLVESDLVVFNTCCVRENAEDKLFGKLGEVKRIKEQGGNIRQRADQGVDDDRPDEGRSRDHRHKVRPETDVAAGRADLRAGRDGARPSPAG